ncbi:chromatin modification- protein eaf6 [Tieghemiomyces parasiticus]|uniref:Chromatin modification-related protein EAF6 n=1 Tax=Tieghemiomyces parasiticus TaxID=78921 RepID=A0A9W8DW07_9FUNG|nr:chromatin modification- protein eaf6 [Tieghemiomyces parasiticus]
MPEVKKEDSPPKAADATPKDTVDDTSAKITAETLKDAEKELQDLLTRKRQVDRNLASLEASIYAFEGSYLEDTNQGNIIRGFDGYLASRPTHKRPKVSENDRIFSNSSSTYQKALEAKGREEQYSVGYEDMYQDRSVTPLSSTNKGTLKKKRLKAATVRGGTPPAYRNPKKARLNPTADTEEEVEV